MNLTYSPQQGSNSQQYKIDNPTGCVIGPVTGTPVYTAQEARSASGGDPRPALCAAGLGAAAAVCGAMGGAPCVLGAFGAAANVAWQYRDPELS
mmetsp:Transcript_6622/g.16250  ORF Transcript_6622/g.16250 Transcript_6622/m.16250 type:complete len:94 (-) Transcript_6622:43-324(-)